MRQVMDAFREGGGDQKPIFLQVALSFASSDAEADRLALEQWRQSVLESKQLADIETPEEFERATAGATVAGVTQSVRSSADIQRHIGWLAEDAAMGFSRLYLHNVARGCQERFIHACGESVIPALSRVAVGR